MCFGTLIRATCSTRSIADYYFFNLPLYFSQISGVVTLFAACGTLVRLHRQNEVTAILAGNDLMAFGALRAAAEMGVSVPQQLSVLGFDGIDMGQYVYPALTSVGYPIRELGETAASVLLERLANPAGETREVVLPPQLVMRASTGPVRGK